MTKVVIWTDGSSTGKSLGPGGYAAIVVTDGQEQVLGGGETMTNHQRMELMAIVALESLTQPCTVTVHTDSAFVANCFIKEWWRRWLDNGWRTSKRQPVKHQDLWERLLAQNRRHEITWCLIPGHHIDYPMNDRCDQLAGDQKRLLEAQAGQTPD